MRMQIANFYYYRFLSLGYTVQMGGWKDTNRG